MPFLSRAMLLIAAGALIFRFLPFPIRYLELDSSIYIRAASEYAAALASGAWLAQAPVGQHYAAVDYWPPLFPLLSGLVAAAGLRPETAAALVAGAAGWLALFPAAFMARRWWGPRAGLLAAALVGFSPILAWYARVPRCEGLFMLLYLGSLAGLLASRSTAGALLGGGCLGLAFATRFDALLLVPGALLAHFLGASPGLRLRHPALWLLGMAVAAAPYLGYLAWLNGGTPTLITPKKAMYDTLEGLWTRTTGRDMYAFTVQFGVPGLSRVDPADPEMRALFETQVASDLGPLLWQGLSEMPRALGWASVNLMPVLLALPALLALGADRRARPLLALYASFPLYAVLTSWDPNSRYYAPLAVPTLLLAVRGLDLLFRDEGWDLGRAGRGAPWLLLGLAAFSWVLPHRLHFDTRFPVDPGLLLGTGPGWLGSAVAAAGAAAAALTALWGRRPPAVAGLAGTAAGLALVLHHLQPAPGLARFTAADLLALALLPLLAAPTLPAPGPGFRPRVGRWILAALLLLAVQATLTMAAMDLAFARATFSPGVARWLEEHPDVRRVTSAANVDVHRTGREWVPVPVWSEVDRHLARLRPDAVILSIPDGVTLDPEPGVGRAARMQATGLYRLVHTEPAAGPPGREWWILLREDLRP